MFTFENTIFGNIISTAIHQAKLEKLREDNLILPRKIFKTVGTEFATFYIDENIDTIREIMDNYSPDDLRPTDNVLDIGACIGVFSLTVHKRVNRVYAVEPLFSDILKKNIELNNAKNIIVLDYALGSGEIEIQWQGHTKTITALSLEDIIKQCGDKIDFIRCDCKGGEWSMTLPDIFNVRRIEAEVYNFNDLYNFKDFENLLISSGFEYTKRLKNNNLMLISATNRYIS